MGTLENVSDSEKLLTSAVLVQNGLPAWRSGNNSHSGRKVGEPPYVAPHKHKVRYDPDAPQSMQR